MRKLLGLERKEQTKRSDTVAKSYLALSGGEMLKYFVGCGNNGRLVQRVLSTRSQWREVVDSKELFINLRWQQSNKGYKYQNCIDNRIFKHSLNHFEHHLQLSNKEFLFRNVFDYCENHKINAFSFLPITFVLNLVDSDFEIDQAIFLNFYNENRPKYKEEVASLHLRRRRANPNNTIALDKKIHARYSKYDIIPAFQTENTPYLWILKPTSYNRGNGVHVFNSLEEMQLLMNKYIQGYTPNQSTILSKLGSQAPKKSFRIRESSHHFVIHSNSFVIQKYMERPLLFKGRKFDIRMWVLFTHQMRVLLFKQGYLRTSSYEYNLNQDKVKDLNVHLTNNAVQKFNGDYGRYEQGNQLSFQHLRGLISDQGKDYDQLMQRIKQIVKITALSVRKKLNKQQRCFCFEIFGYDFMLDSECNPWLIEVNTNPCIQQSSPILQQLLPRMLDDAFSLTLDQIFQSKKHYCHFPVEGQSSSDNLWQFIVDLKK